MRVAASLTLVGAVLAGCQATPSVPSTPSGPPSTASGETTPSGPPSTAEAQNTPSLPPSTPEARSLTLTDPRGGGSGASYTDIVSLVVQTAGDDVTFVLELAESPPANRSALAEEITYLVAVSSMDNSLWLTLENRESGAWDVSLTDFNAGTTPGDARLSGSTITGRVPLDGLGQPSTVQLCAEAQSLDPATGATLGDAVPDSSCLGNPGAPLDVR